MVSHVVSELVEAVRQRSTGDDVGDLVARLDEGLQQVDTPADRAMLLTTKAIALHGVATDEETAELYREAIPLLRSAGLWDAALTATADASGSAFAAGQSGVALGLGFDALALLQRDDIDAEVVPAAAGNLSRIFRDLDSFDVAWQLALQAFEASRAGSRPDTLTLLALNLAEASLESQRHLQLAPTAAIRRVDVAAMAALTIVERGETERERAVLGHGVMAEVSLTRGDVAGARRHIGVALASCDIATDPYAAVLMLVDGMILRGEGRLEEAVLRFDAAEPALANRRLRTQLLLEERADARTSLGDWEGAANDLRSRLELTGRTHPTTIALLVEHTRQGHSQQLTQELECNEAASMAEQLRHDRLTGLDSRALFDLERAKRAASFGVAAVLVLGVDELGAMNDQFGVSAGDDVLRSIGDVLRAECRTDDVVARTAGNTFVILPERGGLSEALALAERLRLTVDGLDWSLFAPELSVALSVGVSSGLAQDLSQTQRQAEAYLDQARFDGGNRIAGPGHAGVSVLATLPE